MEGEGESEGDGGGGGGSGDGDGDNGGGGGRLLDAHERILESETHKSSLSRSLRGTSLTSFLSLLSSLSHTTCVSPFHRLAPFFSYFSLSLSFTHIYALFSLSHSLILAYYRDCPTHFSVTHRAR